MGAARLVGGGQLREQLVDARLRRGEHLLALLDVGAVRDLEPLQLLAPLGLQALPLRAPLCGFQLVDARLRASIVGADWRPPSSCRGE